MANNAACQSSNAEDGMLQDALFYVDADIDVAVAAASLPRAPCTVFVCVSVSSLDSPSSSPSPSPSMPVWLVGLVGSLVGCWCHIFGKILVANFGKTWPSIWPQVRQSETDSVRGVPERDREQSQSQSQSDCNWERACGRPVCANWSVCVCVRVWMWICICIYVCVCVSVCCGRSAS